MVAGTPSPASLRKQLTRRIPVRRVLFLIGTLAACCAAGASSAQQPAAASPGTPAPDTKGATPQDVGDARRQPVPAEQPVPDPYSTRHPQLGGLFQLWYLTAFDHPLDGNFLGNSGKPPPGRSFRGGIGGDLRIRRAQLRLTGEADPRFYYRVMLDFARIGTTSSGPLDDLLAGYRLGSGFRLEIGQQKTGLSEEGTRSDSDQLTVARSIMNSDLPLKAGRVGDVRDFGVVLRSDTPLFRSFVGLWNGNGTAQNDWPSRPLKFLDGSIYFLGVRHTTLGIWGGTNVFEPTPAEVRDRAGATFLFKSGAHFFESEVAYARDYAAGAPSPGRSGSIARSGYVLYGYSLSPKWQLVARYDSHDPAHQGTFTGPATTENGFLIPPANHKLREYTFGVNYYLPAEHMKFQLDYVREDVEQNGAGFFGVPRNVLLLNAQVAY